MKNIISRNITIKTVAYTLVSVVVAGIAVPVKAMATPFAFYASVACFFTFPVCGPILGIYGTFPITTTIIGSTFVGSVILEKVLDNKVAEHVKAAVPNPTLVLAFDPCKSEGTGVASAEINANNLVVMCNTGVGFTYPDFTLSVTQNRAQNQVVVSEATPLR